MVATVPPEALAAAEVLLSALYPHLNAGEDTNYELGSNSLWTLEVHDTVARCTERYEWDGKSWSHWDSEPFHE